MKNNPWTFGKWLLMWLLLFFLIVLIVSQTFFGSLILFTCVFLLFKYYLKRKRKYGRN